MKHFRKILSEIDVAPLLRQIGAPPSLWDEHRERTGTNSPHEGIPDIWVRYRARHELHGPADYLGPHASVWYPEVEVIPAIRKIVAEVWMAMKPRYLGGILITKIPAGKEVKPHHDRGTWHAEYYDQKVYVPLQSNDLCVNACEDEEAVMRAGECWTFDNLKTHSVRNDGETDRITAIICMRGY